jgi:hypothetical protein
MKTKVFLAVTVGATVALGPGLAAQVQTEVPPVVPGAKPVTVEHVKIHGTAILSGSSPTMWSPILTRTTARFLTA